MQIKHPPPPAPETEKQIFANYLQTGRRAQTAQCTIVRSTESTLLFPSSSYSPTSLPISHILTRLARGSTSARDTPPGTTILDCASLLAPEFDSQQGRSRSSSDSGNAVVLCCVWVMRVATPCDFSMAAVCEHLRAQLVEGNRVAVSLFNDGGVGDEDDSEGGSESDEGGGYGEGEGWSARRGGGVGVGVGGDGIKDEGVGAGTYMVVLKRVEEEREGCMPISFSSGEKRGVREYVKRKGDEGDD